MIDLHTHTILSDGELIPSELVRRAHVAGYTAIAITDHVDHSNIDRVLEGVVAVAGVLNRCWDITVIPGVEITHVPIEVFADLVRYAREKGARMVVGHGESPVEPVIPGTNAAAISAGVDILAHPGKITLEDAQAASDKGVMLEITARKGHSGTNAYVLEIARSVGAGLVLNTDTHAPGDLLTIELRDAILKGIGCDDTVTREILCNSEELVRKART
ncbi:MAG: histidinol phosphate phosphatase domain-containing protein [Candidatus Omnitrophica bacterium]|nr:histidinol phosphate phosphatase domain-containing protein [Candidatus Omnitrophota bacterium]MDD5488068.1 histidinol phosphate phosphatase domain-containing protein [Candidatus Omnitrophota bacterium]